MSCDGFEQGVKPNPNRNFKNQKERTGTELNNLNNCEP